MPSTYPCIDIYSWELSAVVLLQLSGAAGARPIQTASIPLGCLSIQQAQDSTGILAGADGPSAVAGAASQQLLRAAQGILEAHRAQIYSVRAAFSSLQQGQSHVAVVATGGTVTTVAALHLQLDVYEHDAVHMTELRKDNIQEVMQQFLCDETSRSSWPKWLTESRAATLVSGCAGLLVLMDWLGVDSFVVSDCDLLDGAVAEMQQRM